ncbi:MAG: hypothetical protein ACI4SR_07715 [Faecalibacillus sp.]
MSKLFHYGFIVFLIIGMMMSKQELMMKSLLQTPFQVFDLVKTLILSACLWNGLLNIIQASGIIDHLSFVLQPILSFIYGQDLKENLYPYLSSNLIANLLGLGTLATLSGLKAIQILDRHAQGQTKKMILLVVINTAGFSVIPSTMMTLRQSYHSQHILSFYPYSLFIGLTITVLGVILVKVFIHE